VHNVAVERQAFFARDVPLKKWTIFSITLPVAQIQVENNSSMPSVNVFCYKNALFFIYFKWLTFMDGH